MKQKASENENRKRRIQTYQKRNIVLTTYRTRKRLQTANKSVLGVFPIYKVHAHNTYIKTAAKMIFSGCKGAKIGKTDKSN